MSVALKRKRKSLQITNVGEGMEKREPSCTVGGSGNCSTMHSPGNTGQPKEERKGKKKKKKNLTAAAQAAVEANGLKDPVLLWLQRRSQLWLGFNP